MAAVYTESSPGNSKTMALCASLFLSSLYWLLLLACGGYANVEDLSFEQVHVNSLLPSTSCSRFKAGGRNSIEIVKRHGPCSGKPPLTEENRLAALAHEALRIASIQATFAGATDGNDSIILGSQASKSSKRPLYSIGKDHYAITVAYGTPPRKQTVIFDTSSVTNWIQCTTCTMGCDAKKEPLFDPALSSTYRNVSCTTPACRGLSNKGCFGTACQYQFFYYATRTVGILSTDTLTLSPAKVIPNFLFGCAQTVQGDFSGIAGVAGFGRLSSYSLNSQVAKKMGSVFSFCLPSTSSSTGFLNIGKPRKTPLGYTPMLNMSRLPEVYHIDLIGISVGGKRLAVSPAVFRSVGTFVETLIGPTLLTTTAYSALRTAFRAGMMQYRMVQRTDYYDTCYDFSTTKKVKYPSIKLHFTRLDVKVPRSGVFYVVSPSQVCLAFMSSFGYNIVGNVLLRTFEVTYDNGKNRIGLSPGACR